MDFKIRPLRGVNDIEFGLNVAVVRGLLGGNFREFQKGNEVHPSDHWSDIGVLCYYDPDGSLEALEFHEPARVFLAEINLLSLHYRDAKALLSRLDSEILTDGAGADFPNISIGIYAPFADDDEEYEPIEAVLVGRPGYYESFRTTDE